MTSKRSTNVLSCLNDANVVMVEMVNACLVVKKVANMFQARSLPTSHFLLAQVLYMAYSMFERSSI
jgi:hypothetical protein